jgi:nicotinate-nucleotide adenylyltransferase
VTSPLSDAARSSARLGVLGGTFDPPHEGHLHAARRARAAFALDHVVFVPAGRPPHKSQRELAPAEERVAMLTLLLAGERACSIWGAELERDGPSYTVDTLHALRREVGPATRFFLVLGEDNLAAFASWHQAEEIVRLAQPVVVHRAGNDPGLLSAGTAALSEFARARFALGAIAGDPVEVSSTELREHLGRGQVPERGLPEPLRAHLRSRLLYRAPESG